MEESEHEWEGVARWGQEARGREMERERDRQRDGEIGAMDGFVYSFIPAVFTQVLFAVSFLTDRSILRNKTLEKNTSLNR